jgi:hypothetical protein
MTALLILLAGLAVLYVALNVRRVRRGRPWAFTVCMVAKDWEQRDRERRLAARAAPREQTAPGPEPGPTRPRS